MNESYGMGNGNNLIAVYPSGSHNGEPIFTLSNMRTINADISNLALEYFYDEDGEDAEIYDLTDGQFKPASEIDFDKYVAVLTERVLKNSVTIGESINKEIYKRDNSICTSYEENCHIQVFVFPNGPCFITGFDAD
jgi:hypothetical protein